MYDHRRTAIVHPSPPGMPTPDAPPELSGGTWLTYRYRLGGEVAREVAGTIKAPSFLGAARKLLKRRLADAFGPGPGPAYLRLRAAGEDEVLLRVVRTEADAPPRFDVVPSDSYQFAEPAAGGDLA